MTKPISKSKRQLAQLLIEAGVTQFPEGANWASQGGGKGRVGFCVNKQVRDGVAWTTDSDSLICLIEVDGRIPNWHQTVLSRDEFDQIVAETVVPRSTAVGDDETNLAAKEELESLEFTPSPTLDQLLQDWRNADDFAQRKQTEADEAAAMRDERWQAVQTRAGEMSVTIGRCDSGQPIHRSVIGWKEWRVGDVVSWSILGHIGEFEIISVHHDPSRNIGDFKIMDKQGEIHRAYGDECKFIRRP